MMAINFDLRIILFNMRDFHHGYPVVENLIDEIIKPDSLLLQEHWLTPVNLYKFDSCFSNYFSFGSSVICGCLESGMLRGRPFGGVMVLINENLRRHTTTIHCEERLAVIKVYNF